MTSLRELYLSHCDSPLFGEGVIVEVKDAEARVVLQSCGQRCDARMIDAILGHVNFFQAAHQLGKNIKRVIYTLLFTVLSCREVHQIVIKLILE